MVRKGLTVYVTYSHAQMEDGRLVEWLTSSRSGQNALTGLICHKAKGEKTLSMFLSPGFSD